MSDYRKDKSLFSFPSAVRPTEVQILGKPKYVRAGEEHSLTCRSRGSKPHANITWFKNNLQVERSKVTVSGLLLLLLLLLLPLAIFCMLLVVVEEEKLATSLLLLAVVAVAAAAAAAVAAAAGGGGDIEVLFLWTFLFLSRPVPLPTPTARSSRCSATPLAPRTTR